MATITKRGQSWFAQVRRKGFTPLHKSFPSKTGAQAWARLQESRMDSGAASKASQSVGRITLSELVDRYIEQVSPRKRGCDAEIARLRKMQRSALFDLSLTSLHPQAIASFRDERLARVKPGTVRRELALLRHIIETARRDWGIRIGENPARLVSLPIADDQRERRLEPGEFERLSVALASMRNTQVKTAFLLAIETGLRRGELLAIEWRYIDLERRTAHIPVTKTGVARTIPLTGGAVQILTGLERRGGKIFTMTGNALRLAWERLRTKAGIRDLRFHDLRHEAISRYCELGLSIPEVAAISGHRDPRMLLRYTHIRAESLAARMHQFAIEGEKISTAKFQ